MQIEQGNSEQGINIKKCKWAYRNVENFHLSNQCVLGALLRSSCVVNNDNANNMRTYVNSSKYSK